MFFFHVLALAIKIVTFFGPIKHIKIEIDRNVSDRACRWLLKLRTLNQQANNKSIYTLVHLKSIRYS